MSDGLSAVVPQGEGEAQEKAVAAPHVSYATAVIPLRPRPRRTGRHAATELTKKSIFCTFLPLVFPFCDILCVITTGIAALSRITLSGHTDAIGSQDCNDEPSARRAKVVRDFLANAEMEGLTEIPVLPSNPCGIRGF